MNLDLMENLLKLDSGIYELELGVFAKILTHLTSPEIMDAATPN